MFSPCFLWVSPTIQTHTGRGTGEYECVCVFGIAVMDWPSVQGGFLHDTGKAPASWPYIGQVLEKMYGIDGWMDGCSVLWGMESSLSACLINPTNVSSLIHISKQNHSEAIHLPNEIRKKERKKERKKKKKKKRLKIGHLACLSAEIAFSCVWNNYYSIS